MSISEPRASILISLILLLMVPFCVRAQGRSTITGFVFGGDRTRLERARVELTDDMGSLISRTETDTSGRFVFNNVGIGRFQLKVTLPGSDYGEETQQVEISGGATRGYETVQVEFHLRARKGNESQAVAGVVFAQDVPPEANRYYQAALVDIDNARSSSAIEQLRMAISVFPTFFAALETLGVEYMKAKKYDDARGTFTSAVAVNARSFNGWYGLAYANFALERFDDAIAAADKATVLDKNSAEVYLVVGLSERKLKQYNLSEKALLKAKELDKGKTPDINWNLALLYAHNLGQYGKAADELELFLKGTPDNPEAANIKKLIASFRSKQAGSK